MEEAGHEQSSVVYYCHGIATDISELFNASSPPATDHETRQSDPVLDRIYSNVHKLLNEHQGDFDKVFVSSNLDSCREQLEFLANARPTAVLLELSEGSDGGKQDIILEFLHSLVADESGPRYKQLVMPFVLLAASPAQSADQSSDSTLDTDYHTAGVIESMRSPLCAEAINDLVGHVKKATRPSARILGVGMAQRLVNSISSNAKPTLASHRPDEVLSVQRKSAVEDAVGEWRFPAHDLDTDELTYGALIMLERVLQNPELESFRLQRAELMTFLLAARREYKHEREVHYHNWRHAVDVTQSIYCFLCNVRLCPPPTGSPPKGKEVNALERILSPIDALTLIVSAIGHDVGHPGVNNAFLVASYNELAHLYNDKSVLENYHCAAYSQLLRRHWPALLEIPHFRTNMISTILATDMQRHFEYMGYLGELKHKVDNSHITLGDWSEKDKEHARALMMALLIKAADISNVARPFEISAQWAKILMDEFARQGELENELQIPTCLFGGPPNKEDALAAAQSQKGFMNLFGFPLFHGISEIMPSVSCTIVELENNKEVWERKIAEEKSLREAAGDNRRASKTYGSVSEIEVQEARTRKRQSEPENIPLVAPQTPTSPQKRQPNIDQGGSPVRHPASEQRDYKQLGLAPNAVGEKRASAPQLWSSSVPLSPTGGASRRSSKDVALHQLQELSVRAQHNLAPTPDSRRASADASWQVHQNHPGSRRGSKEESLTTILVTSQGSQATRNGPSPARGTKQRQSSSVVCETVSPSLLQTAGVGSTVTTDAEESSLQASFTANVEDETGVRDTPASRSAPASSSDPLSHTAEWPADADGAHPTPAPCALPDTPRERPVAHKSSSSPHIIARMTSGDSAVSQIDSARHSEGHVQRSRSRSRLRGLKFWKRRRDVSKGIGAASPDASPP